MIRNVLFALVALFAASATFAGTTAILEVQAAPVTQVA